jgi:hypothetical protein
MLFAAAPEHIVCPVVAMAPCVKLEYAVTFTVLEVTLHPAELPTTT